MTPTTIHIIFKTHLDLGYTDFARNVVRQYFDEFFPKAMAVAESLRQRGGPEKLIWTTGSWLVYELLEQATPEQRARFEAAIRAGDLAWHGLPCTLYSDLLDPSLFAYGLSLAQELDQRFGRKTIAAKMTDVPGHTRGIVPLLAEAGIRFLHIGVNPASTTPDVPPVFVWRDEPSGCEVIVMYHKGSYGELALVPGLEDAIYFAHTNDNLGPPAEVDVLETFARLQAQFPQARVIASTMDAFAACLLTVKDTLPVVTGEIGNSWIHGAGTDPKKVAQLRELMRLRREWVAAGAKEDELGAFSRPLLLVAEHTWGMDEKVWLADFERYDRTGLAAMRQEAACRTFEASWQEQREYISQTVAALGTTRLADEAKSRLAALEPRRPDTGGFTRLANPHEAIESEHFTLAFDDYGALTTLTEKGARRQWAGENNPLAGVRYEIFSAADYERFFQQYIIHKAKTAVWAIPDFTKPGMENTNPPHQVWQPALAAIYTRREPDALRCRLELAFPTEASEPYGCPQCCTVEYRLPDAQPKIEITLQWFEKRACRLPEALWFDFQPRLRPSTAWQMDKLATVISPRQPVRDSERHLHAIGERVWCTDTRRRLEIETWDAPLVAPGQPSLLNYTNILPTAGDGVHFLLYNNLWGTNHPMWYEEDARFRFQMNFQYCP
jgi:hypothetical protein